jgi:hypothetical protein
MHPAIIWRCEETAAATALGHIDGSLISTDTTGDKIMTNRGHIWWDVLLLMDACRLESDLVYST